MIRYLVLILAFVSALPLAIAGSGVHVHGTADLNVVRERSILTLTLEVPVFDAFEVETCPTTSEQKRRVASARAALSKASQVFTWTEKANCSVKKYAVESEAFKSSCTMADEQHENINIVLVLDCGHVEKLNSVGLKSMVFAKATRQIDYKVSWQDLTFLGRLDPKMPTVYMP